MGMILSNIRRFLFLYSVSCVSWYKLRGAPKKFSPNWGGGGRGGGKGKGWGSAVIGMKALKRRAHLSGDLVIFCRLNLPIMP